MGCNITCEHLHRGPRYAFRRECASPSTLNIQSLFVGDIPLLCAGQSL